MSAQPWALPPCSGACSRDICYATRYIYRRTYMQAAGAQPNITVIQLYCRLPPVSAAVLQCRCTND
eukprot:scaffold229015_cov42-Prasinocladus_malaysianus.AAC.1